MTFLPLSLDPLLPPGVSGVLADTLPLLGRLDTAGVTGLLCSSCTLWALGKLAVWHAHSEPPEAEPGDPSCAAGAFDPARLQKLLAALGGGYVAFSLETSGRVRYLSGSAAELLGQPIEGLAQIQDCLAKSNLNRAAAQTLESVAAGEHSGVYTVEVVHAEGHVIQVEVHVSAVRDAQGRLIGFDGIGRDLSIPDLSAAAAAENVSELERQLKDQDEKLRASAAELRSAHERLIQLATAVRSLLWIYDAGSEAIVFSNGASADVLEWPVESLLGGSGWWDLIHPKDRARFDEAWEELSRNGSYSLSYRWRAAEDDEWRWLWERGTGQFNASGGLDHVFGTTEDITSMRRREDERLRLETQLLQAQKMETVGQLAGGVAHDFNNLLTVISAHAELMSADVEPGSELGSSLAAVEDAVTQATRVSRALLGFSRPAVARPERINVPRLVAELGRMVQRILPSTILCGLPDHDDEGPFAHLDPSRLQQVLLNLALGARESMPGGGQLDFSVGLGSPTADLTAPIWIEVLDTGTPRAGAPERPLESALGLGPEAESSEALGLAVARRLVAEMGGELTLHPGLEGGNQCLIRLPQDGEVTAPVVAEPHSPPSGRSVVLAEDDAQVRSVLASVLDSAGYIVHQAGTGDDLLELARRRGSSVDLFIIDSDLPHRTGLDCLRLLRAEGASQPALLISGSPHEAEEAQTVPDLEFLSKPFQLDQMLGAILRLLSPLRA